MKYKTQTKNKTNNKLIKIQKKTILIATQREEFKKDTKFFSTISEDVRADIHFKSGVLLKEM